MLFTNATAHAATLLKNGSLRDDRMLGCVIARARFAALPAGTLGPSSAPPWPIDPSPVENPFGRSPGDKPFYSGGIDVLLGGRVFQPEGRPAGRLDVEVEVGRHFRRRIAVFGDRHWVSAARGVPSAPEPFLSMALRNGLAFGGSAPSAHAPAGVPYSPNPEGRGYYLDAASAEGRPLPNLENPGQLVERCDDRPPPVGTGYYPATGSLRALGALAHPALEGARAQLFGKGAAAIIEPAAGMAPAPMEAPTVDDLRPTLFNQGHPDHVIEARKGPQPGDLIRLSHGRRDGSDLAFALPATPFHLYVQLDERRAVLPLVLDQIGLIGGDAEVMLSYRVVFEYRTVRGERRFATLHPGPLPAEIPPTYRHETRLDWETGFDEASFQITGHESRTSR